MNKNLAKQNIKQLLLQKTELPEQILLDLAKQKLSNIYSATGRDSSRIGKEELNKFIEQNYTSLAKDSDKILDELCTEAIPGHWIKGFLLNFGVLSVFLVVPIYPLVKYAVCIWRNVPFDTSEFASCVIAILLLSILFLASACAVIKDNLRKV